MRRKEGREQKDKREIESESTGVREGKESESTGVREGCVKDALDGSRLTTRVPNRTNKTPKHYTT